MIGNILKERATVLAIALAGVLVFSSGCAGFISSATSGLADNLSAAIMNQTDPGTVRDGAPAFMILIDSLIEGDPYNESLLIAGAKLYAAYAAVFVDDPERARILSAKARDYGFRAICERRTLICAMRDRPHDEFVEALQRTSAADVPALYTCAVAWAGWVQAHSSDFNAIAYLSKVEATFSRVVELDETYDLGNAHTYLGITATLLPPALGGRPEEGLEHFERAIELSEGRNLMAKVSCARSYARLVFDREMHDRLCREVLEADAEVPGLTLINTLAQRDARLLLESADDYF